MEYHKQETWAQTLYYVVQREKEIQKQGHFILKPLNIMSKFSTVLAEHFSIL